MLEGTRLPTSGQLVAGYVPAKGVSDAPRLVPREPGDLQQRTLAAHHDRRPHLIILGGVWVERPAPAPRAAVALPQRYAASPPSLAQPGKEISLPRKLTAS